MMKGDAKGADATLAPKSKENPVGPEGENAERKTPKHSASEPINVTNSNPDVWMPTEKVSGPQGKSEDPIEAEGSAEGHGRIFKLDEELELANKLASFDLGTENELLPGSKTGVNTIPQVRVEEPSLKDIIEGAIGPVRMTVMDDQIARTLNDPKLAQEIKELVASSFVEDKPFDPKDFEGLGEEFEDVLRRLE